MSAAEKLPTAWDRIARLRTDVRDRVLERAAILITHAGLSPEDADERALAEEAGVQSRDVTRCHAQSRGPR